MSDEPIATVEILEDGTPVLHDPIGLAVLSAVEKHNCRLTLDAQAPRVRYFLERMKVIRRSPEEVVVVIVAVDDPHGREIAAILMPGNDAEWQRLRAAGEIPYARGLAGREFMQLALQAFDPDAADKLGKVAGEAIVVVDRGVAEVFTPRDLA